MNRFLAEDYRHIGRHPEAPISSWFYPPERPVAFKGKMLLSILLICFKFVVSNGFQFDEFTGTVLSIGIPITLSWHFDIGDPDKVFFQRKDIGQQFFFQGDGIPAEFTHPNGTLNVTFPSNGRFAVDVIANGTDALNLIDST
ncbi:hypothetical protein ARMSODRAFT_1028180 [Armillaria solidipes]|uniref:Uncharacterized protein n=1 Tax=Armillaria solidipes TaxID=1076256 RepID=A0A2H3B675_9AGAR|nr:hypothetical protein ARMSODRAFT_1028180 [Armillaria solidipes]